MERGREVQLIINPGSTSTKLALFQGEEKMIQEDVVHRTEELAVCETIPEQLPLRMEALQGFLQKHLKKIRNLDASWEEVVWFQDFRTGAMWWIKLCIMPWKAVKSVPLMPRI